VKKNLAILMLAGLATSAAGARTAPHHTGHRARPATHSLYRPSSLNLRAPAIYFVRLATTKGVCVIEVHRKWAPLGADRFYNLVRFGFYNGASFFRVLPGLVVQFGISPKPYISRAWHNAAIPDDPVAVSNLRGTVTFATGGPNTRTTQVFINLADNARLDSAGFSPFGKVVGGMTVIERLYSGYGEGAPDGNGPDQTQLEKAGNAYLARYFPRLDHIQSAVILRARRPAITRRP
jgi:cyclophilin family peptidyl-prolyl cis-trans isomerase